jgi:hypothetical protein
LEPNVFEHTTAPQTQSCSKRRDSCKDGCGLLVWCPETAHVKSDFLKNGKVENLLQWWPVKQLATSRIFNRDLHMELKSSFHNSNSRTSTQMTNTISLTAAALDGSRNTPLGTGSSKMYVPNLLPLDPTNDNIDNSLVSKIKTRSVLDFEVRCNIQPSFLPSTAQPSTARKQLQAKGRLAAALNRH